MIFDSMKRFILISQLIFIAPFFLNAQEDCKEYSCEKQVTDKAVWTNATYTGCVNLFGDPNGFGIQYFTDLQSEGCWVNGEENGRFTIRHEDGTIEYCVFEDGLRNGDSSIRYADGWEMYCTYEAGKKDECRSLIENRYSINDIMCTKKSFEIDLMKNNGHDFIKVEIGSQVDVFLYDTGASSCSMTRELFNSIPQELRGEKLYQSYGPKNTSSKLELTIADGSYADVEFFLLKEITLQGIVIKNVIFGVDVENGSNLIGQDFWNKFSKSNPPKKGKIKVYK